MNKYFKLRIFALLIFSFLFFGGSMAQNTPSFFGLRGGISIPFGDYHAKSLDGGSFAITGLNVSAEGAWMIKHGFGVGAMLAVNSHPIDVAALGRAKVDNDPFMEDVYIRSESFVNFVAMIGPYAQFPVWKKFSVTGKLLCGLHYGETPYQLYKPVFYGIDVPYYEITSAQDWKFSWLVGAGILYDFSPCVGLVLDTDVMYDNLSFTFATSQGDRVDKKTIAYVNISLGFRINL